MTSWEPSDEVFHAVRAYFSQVQIDELLDEARRAGEDPGRHVLAAAGRQALRVRESNSTNGGIVLQALHDSAVDLSWRDVQRLTGIPHGTARRWADPAD